VLHEIDTALRALVDQEIVRDTDVEVDFEAPTKDWATRRNRPTIDIYLYDIRQELSRSQFGQVTVRDAEGNIAHRRPTPKFFRLAYLVTAWTQRPEDEHRLLSALMVTFLRNDTVPAELLSGSLADLGISIPIAVALPAPQDRALSDVWSALGGELKPSLDLTLVAPLLPERFAARLCGHAAPAAATAPDRPTAAQGGLIAGGRRRSVDRPSLGPDRCRQDARGSRRRGSAQRRRHRR
jgi:hypothetical protein